MARRSKISVPLRINPYSPEAVGLQACYVAVPGGMVDLVGGAYGTRVGTADPSRSNEVGTLDAYFDGISDSYTFGSTALIPNTTSPFTVVAEVHLDGIGSGFDSYPVAITLAVTGTNAFRVFYALDDAYDDISFGAASPSRAVLLPSGLTKIGQRHWLVFAYNGVSLGSDSSWNVWVNGQLCTFTTGNSIALITNENRVGGTSASATDWYGAIRQVRLYDRVWGGDLAARFYDPATRDSLFSRPRRRIFLGAPAGGAFNPAWARGSNVIIGGATA
jgi:hypothetical protein